LYKAHILKKTEAPIILVEGEKCAFFILSLIVFSTNLFYNTFSYFNIAFTLGRNKYALTSEAIIASIFKVSVYTILIIGLKDKIFI